MKPFLLMTVLAAALPLALAAQPPPAPAPAPLTLAEAVRLARTQNPLLAARRAEIQLARAEARQARLWPNPELELSAEDMPAEKIGLDASENMIGLSQTVRFPGKRSLDARVADQEVAAVEWETVRQETELVRQVRQAFARAVVAERKVTQLETVTALAETMATATARRVESGAAPDQEQLRADLEHDRARLDLASARREAGATRRALARLLGMAGNPLPPLGDGLREQIDLAALDQTTGPLVAAHPAFHAANARRDRATQADRRARLEPWPDFTLGLAGGRNAASNEDLVEVSLSFPLPIFDRGQARRQETGARLRAAEAELAAVDQRLREQVLSVRARVRTAHDQVAAYRERMLPRAEEALRLVRAGFDAGKLGFADLIDTQRTAAEVRLDYLDRLLDLNLALADWDALVGRPAPAPVSE